MAWAVTAFGSPEASFGGAVEFGVFFFVLSYSRGDVHFVLSLIMRTLTPAFRALWHMSLVPLEFWISL